MHKKQQQTLLSALNDTLVEERLRTLEKKVLKHSEVDLIEVRGECTRMRIRLRAVPQLYENALQVFTRQQLLKIYLASGYYWEYLEILCDFH